MGFETPFGVITITEAARDRVRSLLARADADYGLRVGVEKGGCAGMSYKMEVGPPKPGDEIIEQGGARVIVDAKAVLFLLGSQMDVKTTKFASTFVFENPNQTSACGCGESVALKEADPESLAR